MPLGPHDPVYLEGETSLRIANKDLIIPQPKNGSERDGNIKTRRTIWRASITLIKPDRKLKGIWLKTELTCESEPSRPTIPVFKHQMSIQPTSSSSYIWAG